MVKLVTGGRGTGKSKTMIEMANKMSDEINGNVVFINDDQNHMYELKHAVRFVNMKDYCVKDTKGLIGFLCGLVAGNHDIEVIFIDDLTKITNTDISEIASLITKINAFSQKFHINCVVTVGLDVNQLPEELKEYHIA